MEKINQLKDNRVFLPRAPAKWTTQPTYKQITRIRLTAGGGMAGTRWTEYVEKTDKIESNQLQEFTRITGKKIILNTSHITDAEDFILAEMDYNNQNSNFQLGITHVQYLLEEDLGEIILVDRYGETKTV